MRIAVVTSHFPVPSETFVVRRIAGLLELGHDVEIFADWPGEAAPIHRQVRDHRLLERTSYVEMPAAAGYWEQPVWPPWGSTWLPGAAEPVRNARRLVEALPALATALRRSPRLTREVLDPRRYGSKARSLSPLYRLASLCRARGGFDAIHAHFGWTARDYLFTADLWRAPLVVSFHGGGDLDFGPGVDLRRAYAPLFARAAAVTANSRFTRDRLVALGCPPSRIELLPEGLDLDEFRFTERSAPPSGSVRLLSVGRLVELKGHEYVLRALARVRERHPDVRLDIVGDGPLRDELEALAAGLGVAGAVQLHGALASEEVAALMAEAHLFVMASVAPAAGDREGQGLVLQEAQASGLPVVVTDHGPLPEGVVVGGSALLAPERDPGALADRIMWLIEHPAEWPAMGRAGRAHVERHYDARDLNRRLERLLAEVARVRRASHPLPTPAAAPRPT